MKKLISTMVMLAILVFALSTSVQAYTMSFANTKTEVESGETFDVTISVDELTALANGQLFYDSSLFTFVGATQDDMSAQAYPGEGKVNWMYTELQDVKGIKEFTFTFKAADVTETKKGTFTLKDFTVTTLDDKEYDDASSTIAGTKSVDVTIKKKTEPSPDKWTLDPSKDFELSKGEVKQIKTDGDVTWTTSDPKIATVDKDGNVKGIGKGTATITATDKDGNTKSVKVTVKDVTWKIEPSGDIELTVGDKKQIKADEDVTWKSSNEKVVTVDKKGNVVAVGAGTATITATDKYGNTRTIKITVKSKTAGTKDNTLTPDKKLPQTGEEAGRYAVLGIACIVLVAGLIFKKKVKNLNKLFVILPLVAALSISGAVNAIKIVDDSTMKAGVFGKGELVDGLEVIAVSPSKEFKTDNSLTVEMIKNIVGMESLTIADAKGNVIENPESIATGYIVTTPHPYSKDGENVAQVVTDYTVLLYGDANGDGKICNCLDVNVIRQDYVFNNKAEGVYKKAADLYADDVLNVRDVQRMVKKYLGTLDGSLVTPFPGEKGIVLTPSEDVTLNVGDTETVTAKDEDGNDIDVKWTSSNPDVATVDENGKITAVGPGTTTITATDDNGNEQSIEVTVVAENVGVNPEFSVNVETEGDKATVTVDVTNKEEVEKYSKIKGYNFAVVKIPTGPNQSAQTIKTVKSEEPTYTFEDLEDGAYQVVVTVSTEKGAHKTVAKAFSINNSNDDGLTTDKTKAVAYAQYVKPEDGSTSDYLYFTSVQSAVNYVKNNVIKDNRQHVAGIGLLKDVTESIVIDDEINTHINFNLNGHTLTGAKAGNTITINTYNMQFNVNNHEFNLENEEENSNNKKTTGGINASGAEGDNCVYLAGENVIFTVYEHMIFRGLTNSGAAIKAAQDTTTVIRVYDTTWEAPNATCLFIDDLGNGGIIISDGTYKGYINIIKQAGDGNITIGAESQVISETEPEKATPRFEAHDSIINAPNSTINFNYGYLTQRTLDVNNFKLRKDAYLYKTASVAYYIRLKEGQTLNEKAAVAELLPEGSLYETVQGAVNAADGHGAVRLLKDVTESVVIPENKNIQLDLNEKTLTGAEDKMYTINVLGDLEVTSKDSATKGKIIRTQTTAGLETPNKNDIVATNILLEGNGNVKVLDNVELHEEVGGGADIANLGSGNITIDGAYLFAGEQGVNTIRDFGNGGNIYVFSGELSGGAINKRNSGNVYIGKDSNPVSGIEGVQEKILLQDTTPQKLIIEGGGQANHAIDLGEDVQLYYYNGEIKGAINVTKEPVLRSTDRIVRGSENRGLHYETLAEGELPISYSKLYSADQVVLEEAVVYMQDNTELFYSTNYYRYFSSLQAAINVEPHRTEELREDEELVTVKINDINLNKDITESVVVPENKRVVLHLNAHTIVGADDKPYTINVLGKLDINKEGGRIVRNDSSTGNSEISNILLEKTGDLKVYKDAREGEIELILNTRGANIRNKGTGNITIEGHNVKIYDTLESDEGSDEDNGTYGIYDEGTGNIIVDGKISAFTAIRKENSGNIYIGKNDSIVSESNPYIRGFKCIEANPNCHVYYYSGMLGRVYAPKNTSRLDNSARVCQDLQGNQLNFAGVRSDFGEQCGINCAWDGPAINKTTEGETTAGYDVISYYHITQTSEVSLDTEVVNAGNDAVSDIVNN